MQTGDRRARSCSYIQPVALEVLLLEDDSKMTKVERASPSSGVTQPLIMSIAFGKGLLLTW